MIGSIIGSIFMAILLPTFVILTVIYAYDLDNFLFAIVFSFALGTATAISTAIASVITSSYVSKNYDYYLKKFNSHSMFDPHRTAGVASGIIALLTFVLLVLLLTFVFVDSRLMYSSATNMALRYFEDLFILGLPILFGMVIGAGIGVRSAAKSIKKKYNQI
jgi:hypothetical protein